MQKPDLQGNSHGTCSLKEISTWNLILMEKNYLESDNSPEKYFALYITWCQFILCTEFPQVSGFREENFASYLITYSGVTMHNSSILICMYFVYLTWRNFRSNLSVVISLIANQKLKINIHYYTCTCIKLYDLKILNKVLFGISIDI